MATSEARINANRLNSLKSCGPKSPESKAISRQNSLKHGLTGAGIVIAGRDAAEVESRKLAFQAELNPQSDMGKYLVDQMAILSVRAERSFRQETAAIARNVRNAIEDFEQGRLDEVDRLLDELGDNPRRYVRKLLGMPEGVDGLIEAWQDLRVDLAREHRPVWTAGHEERAENLLGYKIDGRPNTPVADLSRAIRGDFSALPPPEIKMTDEARKAQARAEMIEMIDAEVAELDAHYKTLDFQTLALDRAEAGDRALFDPSKEATLARRYEAEAIRCFYKALKELRRVEQEIAENQAPEAPPIPPPLASSRGGVPTPREPQPMPPQTRVPMSDPASNGPEIAPNRLDRPPPGSV